MSDNVGVIRHGFHSYFLSIFWSNFLHFPYHPFFLLMFIFLMFPPLMSHHTHKQMTRKQFDWYYTSLPRTIMRSTWLLIPQSNLVPLQPPDPALEPLWPPSLAPTVQSSGLPRHGVWVGVRPPHKDPDWLKGSSSVPQQDLPDWLPPFNKPRPQILQGTCQTWPAQGRLLHQPPGSQQHRPMESW